MVQYQAGFILEALKEFITSYTYTKDKQKAPMVQGLLNNIATFDVSMPADELYKGSIHPLLAVANNIITRGLPTLASGKIEQEISSALNLTHNLTTNGSIRFPAIDPANDDRWRKCIRALYLVDPRARERGTYLNVSDTDSAFERNFLLTYIPEDKSYLAQLFQHQRARASFTRDGNQGRVDFSCEIPYYQTNNHQNKYRQQVEVKCRSCFIIEVDGEAYHQDHIDELKEFELGQLPRTVRHIREKSSYDDAHHLFTDLLRNSFIQIVEQNFNDQEFLLAKETAFALVPILIARIQKSLIEYLIRHQNRLSDEGVLKIAVIERDLPAAILAVADLKDLLQNLNSLAGNPISIPEIALSVFCTDEFKNHPLQSTEIVKSLDDCKPADYDLVLDVSIFRRSSLFKDDDRFASPNTWLVRSAHFTHYQTCNPIYCAQCIIYQPITTEVENEVHLDITDNVNYLSYFLRLIFRKESFREGQTPIINRALQLKSVIGLLPTGGGKSLTYQISCLLQPGISIIVDPIRSLMVDQYRGLRELGIDRCEFLNSTLSSAEKRYNQNKLLPSGQLQFVFVSPERFVIEEFREALRITASRHFYFSYVVIDEVHCVSEWGHDFRTPYLNLGQHGVEFCRTANGSKIPLFGLTATASFDVLADIERELHIPDDDGNAVIRYENTVRDEINYIVEEVRVDERGVVNPDKRMLRNLVGEAKQQAVFKLLRNKEDILKRFNAEEARKEIVSYSWQNYVSNSYKENKIRDAGTEAVAFSEHVAKKSKDMLLDKVVFSKPDTERNELKYKYGAVIFTPHRKGKLGIAEGGGILEHTNVTHPETGPAEFGHEKFGFFMGSGDDENAAYIDKASFENLDEFIHHRLSVMVATKAFGMGIDKTNVRMTVHINIPQSIESFVQEAGRAGRDKKMSCSMLLYNDQTFEIVERHKKTPYHLDKDVLMFFHRNSFKGQIKERAMIYELRSAITFPTISNANKISNLLNELYGNSSLSFKVKCGANNWANHVFVNAGDDMSVGSIALDTLRIVPYDNFSDKDTCREILDVVSKELPSGDGASITRWLNLISTNTRQETGIEKMLLTMTIGEKASLQVPFINRYYTSPAAPYEDYRLNLEYIALVKSTSTYKTLIDEGSVTVGAFERALTEANKDSLTFPDFVDILELKNPSLEERLKDQKKPDQLHITYYRSRSHEDTAKAIYRLISIGVIDAYTIDYQNKIYTLHFTCKEEIEYFYALEKLIARYTSRRAAATLIEEYKRDYAARADKGKVTVLSYCLEKLTNFVYDQIRQKRIQAIDDMVSLCRTAIAEKNNPFKQNMLLKDEIFYYFNAKYSRKGFHEPATGAPASLLDDREVNLTVKEVVEKYVGLVEDQSTGQFINNIKHLRGSTMRMLRSFGDEPSSLVLKGYSLFVLSVSVRSLLSEAKKELVNGLILWKKQEDNFNPVAFITWLRSKVEEHVDDTTVTEGFDDIEDLYYTHYYADWTKHFLKNKLSIH